MTGEAPSAVSIGMADRSRTRFLVGFARRRWWALVPMAAMMIAGLMILAVVVRADLRGLAPLAVLGFIVGSATAVLVHFHWLQIIYFRPASRRTTAAFRADLSPEIAAEVQAHYQARRASLPMPVTLGEFTGWVDDGRSARARERETTMMLRVQDEAFATHARSVLATRSATLTRA